MISAGWFTVSLFAVAFLSAMATAVYGWLARCRHIMAGGFDHAGSFYYITKETARFPESENVSEDDFVEFDSQVVRGPDSWRGVAGRVGRL